MTYSHLCSCWTKRGKGKKNRAVMRVFDKESNLVWNSDWESGKFIPFLSESDNPQDNEAENYIFKCEEYNVKDSSGRLLIGKKCHIINKQEDGRLRCLEAMEYNEGDTDEHANVKGNLTVNRCSSENEMQVRVVSSPLQKMICLFHQYTALTRSLTLPISSGALNQSPGSSKRMQRSLTLRSRHPLNRCLLYLRRCRLLRARRMMIRHCTTRRLHGKSCCVGLRCAVRPFSNV